MVHRQTRFRRPRHRHSPLLVATVIGILALLFGGYYFLHNNAQPGDQPQNDRITVKQQPRTKLKSVHQSPKKRQPIHTHRMVRPTNQNLIRAKVLLQRSRLTAGQRQTLIRTYQKLSPKAQRRILNLIETGQHGIIISKTKLNLLKKELGHN